MASNTTQDHDFIREWAEKRGAKPAEVASTETENQVGILRLEFPDAPNANDDALKEISWDDFFEKFDQSGLEFLYQEETAGGEQSNFNKLVYPDPESDSGKRLLKKTAGRRVAASRKGATKSASKGGAKTASKSAAKKGAKSAPQKSAAKTSVAKKSAPAKLSAKKTAVKKVAGKKVAAKTVPKKAAKKVPAKKTPAKKAPAKKQTTNKVVAKKTTNSKTTAKKTTSRRGR